jgi:hypothetical protein
MTVMQEWVTAQDSPEIPVNENFDTLGYAAVYGYNPATSSGLTWGYYGGRWGGFAVAASTLTLTDASTNYIVVLRSSGVISVSTTDTNWNNDTAYARVYRVTTTGGTVSNLYGTDFDYRAGDGGIFGSSGGGGGGGGTIGKQAIYISAAAMTPSATGGCAALATIASAANQPDIQTLNFDTTTQEFAQFSMVMPKKWNEGTVTYKAHWSHAATTTNFGVAWQLQGVAVSDDDAIAVAYGTAVTVTDTGGTTNDLYQTAESGAVTIGGTPAAEDMVFFRFARDPANGSDNMAIDARLHGITVYVTTDAETDA